MFAHPPRQALHLHELLALFLSLLCARPKLRTEENRDGALGNQLCCTYWATIHSHTTFTAKDFPSPASQKTFIIIHSTTFVLARLSPDLNSNFIFTLHEKMRTSLGCELFQLFSAPVCMKHGLHHQIFTQFSSLTLKLCVIFFGLLRRVFTCSPAPQHQMSALEAQNHEFEASRSDCHYHRQFIKWDWTSTAFVSSANKMKNRNKYRSFPSNVYAWDRK